MEDRESYLLKAGHLLKIGALTAIGIYFTTNAFTRSVRRQIWERAGGVSELSGRSDWPRECSHYNHDREYIDYNNPNNGILVLRGEHYIQHIENEGNNGLDYDGNQWALEQIWERMTPTERSEVIMSGYPPPEGYYQPTLL